MNEWMESKEVEREREREKYLRNVNRETMQSSKWFFTARHFHVAALLLFFSLLFLQ
jgi:hypothetical protein